MYVRSRVATHTACSVASIPCPVEAPVPFAADEPGAYSSVLATTVCGTPPAPAKGRPAASSAYAGWTLDRLPHSYQRGPWNLSALLDGS